MRNAVHEISGCHTINLRRVALQISFRRNCSNEVFAFPLRIVGLWKLSLLRSGQVDCRTWSKRGKLDEAA